MSNPSDAPQPQPGSEPPTNDLPPGDFRQPPGYQTPPDDGTPPAYQEARDQGAPDQGNPYQGNPYQGTAQPGYGAPQPGYGAPLGASNNAPPAGLGYEAPARNTFGLDFNNLGQRLSNTQGVPQQLVISYWLWIAAAALGVLLSLINIFALTNTLGGVMVGAGIATLILSLIFAALYIFIAIRLKEGARWARLVLSILGGLAAIGLLTQLAAGNLSSIGSAVAVAAAILMWLPQSREHFTS